MASGITASRLALGAVLEAAGLRVVYDPGLVTPPGVLVTPTDPWLTPTQLATVSSALRWRVAAVAGRADATVTLEDLEGLVSQVVVAVASLPDGWGRIGFDGPGTVDLGGAQYLAAIGRLDHLTEV